MPSFGVLPQRCGGVGGLIMTIVLLCPRTGSARGSQTVAGPLDLDGDELVQQPAQQRSCARCRTRTALGAADRRL